MEYWHGQEYIDDVVDKRFSPKSFTLNPVYNRRSPNTSPTAQRYRKKNEGDSKSSSGDYSAVRKYRKREEARNSDLSTCAPKSSNTGSADVPRKTTHDYAEKYVATAAGSNFYSYDPSPNAEPSTNLDDDDDGNDDDVIPGLNDHSVNPENTCSSFKPAGNKITRKKKRSGGERRRSGAEDSGGRSGGTDVYAVCYKDRLRKNLDNWSAEESDV